MWAQIQSIVASLGANQRPSDYESDVRRRPSASTASKMTPVARPTLACGNRRHQPATTPASLLASLTPCGTSAARGCFPGLNLTQLPATIAAAAQGRISGLLAATLEQSPLYCPGYRPLCLGVGDQGFSLGAYLTVLCRDQAPFINRAALANAAGDDPAFRELVDGNPYLAACTAWGVAPANPVVARPPTTEVPLLLLVGQFDSYSSAAQARQVAATLPRAWVVQVPGSTHNALGFSDCPLAIRNTWVQAPTSPPQDTSCLESLRVSFATAP
jgi:hypothetical protein